MPLLFTLLLSANLHAQAPVAAPAPEHPESAPAITAPDRGGPSEPGGAVKMPKVSFGSPKEGETVPGTFTVKMQITGMKIKKAGVLDVGTGHHHLIVDGAAIPKGQVVPKDETNIHYGGGETTAKLTLKPGPHTLTLQFADGNHLSYGPELSQTIKVIVK